MSKLLRSDIERAQIAINSAMERKIADIVAECPNVEEEILEASKKEAIKVMGITHDYGRAVQLRETIQAKQKELDEIEASIAIRVVHRDVRYGRSGDSIESAIKKIAEKVRPKIANRHKHGKVIDEIRRQFSEFHRELLTVTTREQLAELLAKV